MSKYLDWWLHSPANFKGVDVKDRTRCYATIVYPDNKGDPDKGLSPTPSNWKEILQDFNVPCFISPFHDKDDNSDEDNTLKKPHYHVMIMYDGVKTIRQFDRIRNAIGGVGFFVVESISGYARYLCHIDHPHKYQYNINDVICFNGADYDSTIGNQYNRKDCIIQMLRFIDRAHVKSYSQLVRYALKYEPNWFSCLMDNSFMVREYIKGVYLEYSDDLRPINKKFE